MSRSLPPEIIDHIMIFYTHMLQFDRPAYLFEIEALRDPRDCCRSVYDRFHMIRALYRSNAHFREFAIGLGIGKLPIIETTFKDNRPKLSSIGELSALWNSNTHAYIFDRLSAIYRAHDRLNNHRLRILKIDGYDYQLMLELPFYHTMSVDAWLMIYTQ